MLKKSENKEKTASGEPIRTVHRERSRTARREPSRTVHGEKSRTARREPSRTARGEKSRTARREPSRTARGEQRRTARRERSRTVFVGMSGGVDSSVAAALLKEEGYRVVGVHLRCFNVDGCAERDAEDARRAAEAFHIPLYTFDFEKEYKEAVVDYMVREYKTGRTPNPDVMCNKEIKFGLFFKKALEMGADYVATGHYVRLKRRTNVQNVLDVVNQKKKPIEHYNKRSDRTLQLFSAKDESKDQSYFLWTLTQKQLKQCLFPLGDLIKKTDVRSLAKKFGLPNAEKKDSQGICFLGAVSLPEFLGNYIPEKAGVVVNSAGKKIGEHRGSHLYTIGQRQGLGIGGGKAPLYIAEKNNKTNTIVMAEEDSDLLYRKGVELSHVNFITPPKHHSHILKNVRMSVWCRVRYRQPLAKARLMKTKGKYILEFAKPMKFVAEGQSAVFYAKSGEMLGGGVIERAF